MASFREIWSVDSEWGFRDGHIDWESTWVPVVICFVGLHTGTRLSFWSGNPALRAFLLEHQDDLFITHNALAEMKFLLRLGIPLPEHWYDSFAAERLLTNAPGHLEAALSISLHRRNLPHLAPALKKDLQKQILHLRFDHNDPAERRRITDYCFSDCDGALALYLEQQKMPVKAEWMIVAVEFLKAVARMELRGILINTYQYDRIASHWLTLKKQLIADVNKTYVVFVEESFKKKDFLNWAKQVGIVWPTAISPSTGKPYFPLDNKTLKDMESRHPFIARVRQTLKSLKSFGKRRMVIDGCTGRHHFNTSVFRSVTGRNQPKGFIFSGPKWQRFLIVPESPDHVVVYVDFVAQEFGIAAALSNDPAMREVYTAADCHMALAIRTGAAPAGATKGTHGDIRKKYKTVNLGVLFGQTAFGIAARLGIEEDAADALLAQHKQMFPRFWEWSEFIVQGSFDRRWIVTPNGWRSYVPPFGNERTWMNWPVQSTGGDIMRLTVIYLDRQNVRILAPVHDGFLLSCRRDQLADLKAAVDYACAKATEHVLPGFPLRWDFTVYEQRFEDEDGQALWDLLQSKLEKLEEDEKKNGVDGA